MKKDIFVMGTLVFLMIYGSVFFPQYAYISFPILLIGLTVYSFAANNTRCPKCKRSFSRKKMGSETEVHTDIGTPSYFDDYMFNDVISEYRCTYCGHMWSKEKDIPIHGK